MVTITTIFPRHRLNLVVRPNVLAGGSTYTFRLSATDVTSQATGALNMMLVGSKSVSNIYAFSISHLKVVRAKRAGFTSSAVKA